MRALPFHWQSLALLALLSPIHAEQTPPAVRHVVLVTIDGLRGDYLGEADRYHLRIPTLRALAARGAMSAHTLSVFPTLTGTAHTSLVTGVPGGRHGILGNNKFTPEVWTWDRDNYDAQPPYRDYGDVRVESLWSAARARGLKTAAIAWPQTVGAPIDYRLEVPVARTASESHDRIVKTASPGWLPRIEAVLGPLAAVDLRMADHVKALVAAQILQLLAPSFMAVHFSLTDAVQHAEGPRTPAALAALEDTDHNLGIVVDAIGQAKLANDTTVIVTGDHGFVHLHTELAINLPLVEVGLAEKGPDGALRWRALIAPNRGLGSLYVKQDAPPETLAKARQALDRYAMRYAGRFRLLERAELDRYGADPAAALGIEPLPGYVLDARLSPPFARAHNRAAGHGYRPDLPDMHTGLIIAGARARPGVVLAEARTIDVAPTIGHLLGFELSGAEGSPIVGAFERTR
jgi:predicted AlkP superfamily pyrophosphatase or phosphodiesterase